jgi:hypothetical protein
MSCLCFVIYSIAMMLPNNQEKSLNDSFEDASNRPQPRRPRPASWAAAASSQERSCSLPPIYEDETVVSQQVHSPADDSRPSKQTGGEQKQPSPMINTQLTPSLTKFFDDFAVKSLHNVRQVKRTRDLAEGDEMVQQVEHGPSSEPSLDSSCSTGSSDVPTDEPKSETPRTLPKYRPDTVITALSASYGSASANLALSSAEKCSAQQVAEISRHSKFDGDSLGTSLEALSHAVAVSIIRDKTEKRSSDEASRVHDEK